MKRRSQLLITAAAILAMLLCGCHRKSDVSNMKHPYEAAYYEDALYDNGYAADFYDDMEMAVGESEAVYSKSVPSAVSASGNSTETPVQTRMIQKSANINIQVMDPLASAEEIISMTEQMGGFVISSSSTQEYYSGDIYLPRADLSIRVPSERLLEMLGFIEGLTTDTDKYVTNKRIYGYDITSEYVDTKSRLASLEKTRDKLYEIMDTADNASDALEVYTSIAEIETDIEVYKGQLKYMEESVSLSSIDIRVNSIKPAPIRTVKGWDLGDVFKDAFGTLLDAGKALIEILVYVLIVGIPILILIAIPVVAIVLIIKKVRKNKKNTSENDQKIEPKEDVLAEVKRK